MALTTLYLDTPSFTSATVVFSDSDLLICAPDGFYSDGVIVREQVGCVLLPEQLCPSCPPQPVPAPVVPVPAPLAPVPAPVVPVPAPVVPQPVPVPVAPVPAPLAPVPAPVVPQPVPVPVVPIPAPVVPQPVPAPLAPVPAPVVPQPVPAPVVPVPAPVVPVPVPAPLAPVPAPVVPVPAPVVPVPAPVVPVPAPAPASTNCQFVFVPNSQSTTDRGLRYNNGGEINTPFSSLFGVPSTEGGVEGVVYGVCSSITPLWLIVSTNVTTAYPSGSYPIGTGGSCTVDFDCQWTPSPVPAPVVPVPAPTAAACDNNIVAGNNNPLSDRGYWRGDFNIGTIDINAYTIDPSWTIIRFTYSNTNDSNTLWLEKSGTDQPWTSVFDSLTVTSPQGSGVLTPANSDSGLSGVTNVGGNTVVFYTWDTPDVAINNGDDVCLEWSGTTPTPVAPIPAPVAPVPAPVVPVPVPVAPVPQPVAPVPQPVPAPTFPQPQPVPAPVAPSPIAPSPAPVPFAPVPAPVAPVPQPQPVPAPTFPQPQPVPAPVAPSPIAPSPAPVPFAPVPAPVAPVPQPVAPVPVPQPVPVPIAPVPAPVAPVPVPAPVASFNYYAIDLCNSGPFPNYLAVRSAAVLTVGKSVKMPDGECYEILGAGPANTDDYIQQYKNCSLCPV